MADLDFSDLGVPESQPLSFRTEPDLRRAAAFTPTEQASNLARETSDDARAELEAAIASAPHATARAALEQTYARDFGASPGLQRRSAAAAPDFSDLGAPEPQAPAGRRRGDWGAVKISSTEAESSGGGQLDYFLNDLKIGWNGLRKSIEGGRLSEYGDLVDAFERRYTPQQIEADPNLKAEYQLRRSKFAESQARTKEIDDESQALQKVGRPSYRKLQEANDSTWTLDNLSRLGKALVDNPGSAVSIVTQSGPGSAAMLASAVVARFAGFSPTVAAAAGGNASRVVEFGSDYADLREKGYNHEDAYRDATIKSGVVGLLDAASMKSAGSALDEVLGKGGFFGKVKRTAKEVGTQAGLGMAGEAGGSLASGRTPDPLEVLAEGIGEVAMAPVEGLSTMSGRLRGRNQQTAASTAPVPADEALGGVVRVPPTVAPTDDGEARQRLATLSGDDPALTLNRVETLAQEIQKAEDEGTDDGRARAFSMREERDALAGELLQGVERGRSTTLTTESGARIDADFGVVEADQLQASHRPDMSQNPEYPAELQPRDRSRAASELQVAKISGNLTPERLAESGDAGTGAPIIGADGLVESGNARTIGVQRAYLRTTPQAQAYRDWLVTNAAQFGLDPDRIASMRNPMLVRVRRTPVNRVEFATQANQATVAQMSPSELARSDAQRMGSLDGLHINDDGEFMLPVNDGIIRGFFRSLPITEQAALVDQNGRVSPAGYARFRNALLAKAYGNNPVVEKLTESMSPLLRNLTNALIRMAPMVAKAKEQMQAGQMADRDITDDIVRAVDELVKLRMEGRSLGQMLAQSAMFTDLSPETIALMEFLDENVRSPSRIGEFIQSYLDELQRYGSESQGDMFGGVEVPGRADLIQTARAKVAPNAESQQPEAAADQRAEARPDVQSGAAAPQGTANADTTVARPEKPAEVSGATESRQERADESGGGAAGAASTGQGAGSVEAQKESSKPVEKAEAKAKPKREPKPKAEATKQLTAEEQAQADLDAALGDLGDLLGKGTRLNITPEQESKLVPILTRLFDAAFRLGYHKFKRAAKFVLDTVRAKLGAEVSDQITIEHLQGAYIGMSGKYREQGADAARDVVTVDTLQAIEAPEQPAAPAPSPVDEAAHQAATSPQSDAALPTEGQKEAGNYQKGHVMIGGLDVSIENPEGSVRSGTDANGQRWEIKMRSHYGYIKRTEAADGDHIDVFIKPGTPTDYEGAVWVIDQNNADGSFDEQKVMIGWADEQEARGAYLANYTKGWESRILGVRGWTMERFRTWLKTEDTTKPASTAEDQVREGARRPGVRDAIKAAGLKVTKTGTKNGSDVWEVSGNTREHSDLLKRLGGRWYGPKKVWSFYKGDPSADIAKAIGGTKPVITESVPVNTETKPAQSGPEPTQPETIGSIDLQKIDIARLQQAMKVSRYDDGNLAAAYRNIKAGHAEAALAALEAASRALFKQQPALARVIDQIIESAQASPAAAAAVDATTDNVAPAHQRLAEWVKARLHMGQSFTSNELFAQADKDFGGTQAEGKYTPKDAYDALELGVNQFMLRWHKADPTTPTIASAKAQMEALAKIMERIPTQTKRTQEQDEFQQFSTPPTYAYLANWVANIRRGETYLEPSAGIGGLAVFGKNAGANVVVNEFSPRRATILRAMGFDRAFTENAEQLHNALPDDVKPSVIVMNPPFSATAGRIPGQRDFMNGARHIDQALQRLVPGGRLVVIMGKGRYDESSAWTEWIARVKRAYTLAADVVVDGKEYAKYGTTFDVRFMVFDKTGTTQNSWSTVKGEVASPIEALALLEGVRNARPQIAGTDSAAQHGAAEPARPQDAQGGGRDTGAGQPAPASTAAVGDRQPGAGARSNAGSSSPAGAPQSGDVRGTTDASVSVPDGGRRDGGAGDGTVRASEQPEGSSNSAREPGPRPDSDVKVSSTEDEAAKADLTESVFESYAPQRLSIPGALAHPGKLVQSAAMASVSPPAPTYTPNLPKSVIEQGMLSLAQLEAVVYAGQAHDQTLPSGERMGFFIGDGTGVGKGREISGIILDNMRQGRNRAVWISEKQGLYKDARRDFSGVGGNADLVFKHSATKYGDKIKATGGILFTTYATMRQDKQKAAKKKGQTAEVGKSRVDQIADWLGADFDGVIVFDEAHNMGNAISMKGDRGMVEASEQALAGVELQRRLPQARVVYVSATGATEVSNLSYASRLGLWGEGTPFPTVQQFIGQIEDGGLSGMELVARDIKQMGAYLARSLSFDGVTYSRLEHPLTSLQRDIYNELARSWQIVLQNVNDALALTGAYSTEKGQPKNGRARAAAMSAFWGAHQRFFNQIITSMQMPAVIEQLHKDIKAGEAAVLQLVNTNEAIQNRQLATMAEDETLEDLDLTPRENLVQYIKNSFPIVQYEEYLDENNNKKTRPAKDSAGNVLISKEAVAKRDALLETLQAIRVPDGPLEIILNEFGTDVVAEVTGRGKRVLRVKDKDGSEKTIVETRPGNAAQADAESFMSDKKRILVFSDAGGTGFSFHADLTKPNQRKRKHYLIQPGWRADKAVQGFGRTHRTNQKSEPHYYLVTTDLLAQKRFISSIARRLDQLGALTKGQRDTANQGLFTAKDNLESKYAEDAVLDFFTAMHRGQAEGFDFQQTTKMLGFDNLIDEKTGQLVVTKIPHVPQFLNRLLSLETHEQERVFNEFSRRMDIKIDKAIAEGTLDAGMQTVRAKEVRVKSEQVVNTDERTGAETRYVEFELTQPTRFYDFDTFARKPGAQFFQNIASGKVWSAVPGGRTTKKDGSVVDRLYMHGTGSGRYVEQSEITPDKFRQIDADAARTLWDAENTVRPKTYTEPLHMVVGSLLPVWDRMPGFIRVARTQTADGNRYLGRIIAPSDLNETLKRLGATSAVSRMDPADILKAIMEEGRTVELANGWRLMRRRVSNENRLEIDLKSRFPSDAVLDEIKRVGGFVERIQYQERAFLPANDVAALQRFLKARPVVDLTETNKQQPAMSRPATRETRWNGRASASVANLRRMVGEVGSKLKRKPSGGVLVVEFPDELPAHLRNYLLSQNAMEDVEGLYDPDTDAIYLIARNIPNDARGQYVLFHELFGHFGLRGLFGNELNGVLEIVAANNANIRASAARKRTDFGYDVPLSIEEAMSDLAAEGRTFNGLKRFMAALQAALRRIGLGRFADMLESITDAEALRVIAMSRSYVEGNLTPAQYRAQLKAQPVPTMSQSNPAFYSTLTRAVAAIPQKRATVEQWKGLIKNLKGVKSDEIEWSGVMDWLSLQSGQVTREALVEYLHLNGVKVEETLQGGDVERNRLAQERSSLVVQLDALGYSVTFDDDNTILHMERRSDGEIFRLTDEAWPSAWDSDNPDAPGLEFDARPLADRLAEVSSEEYDNQEEGGTRYESYTLPGGENYRELLLTLPMRNSGPAVSLPDALSGRAPIPTTVGPEFRSSHWDEPNIIAHVRFNERTDADGNRVLFLEELQSDWAQQGKRKGFDTGAKRIATKVEKKDGYFEVTDQNGRFLTNVYEAMPRNEAGRARDEAEALAIAQDRADNAPQTVSGRGVPTGPFVQKTEAWVALALKRMIRWAAENGFDRIAWTTGEQQADRYDLSKRVSRVEFHDNRSGGVGDAKMEGASSMGQLLAYDLQGRQVLSQPIVDPAQIAEFVGKDVADKLLAAAPESIRIGGISVRRRRVNGLDLKVGGDGMIAFYDKIVPGVARDVIKKLNGGAMTSVRVWQFSDKGEQVTSAQPGFDITPKMREIAMQGLPLFSRAGVMPARTGLIDRTLAATTRAVGVPKLTGGSLRLIRTLAESTGRKVLGTEVVEDIKAGLVDKYGLNQAVLDRRAEMYGRQATQLKGVEKLIDQLGTLTRSELAVLYRAATTADGDEVNAMISDLPEESKAVLANMKGLVQELGKEAVRLGQMQAETFQRNEWAYLHRTYRKFELEQTKGEAGARARRISVLGDAYKLRGMLGWADMKRIQNVAPDFWKRKLKDGKADTALKGERFIRFERRQNRGEGVGVLDGMDESNQLGRLLEVQYWPASEPVPSRYGAWHEAGTWEARFFGDRAHPGQIGMWRDFTADERTRMGEIDDVRYAFARTMHTAIHNVEVGRYLEWLANTQAVAKKEQLPAGATLIERDESGLSGLRRVFRPDEWVKVPESRTGAHGPMKYGKLAGMIVPGPVWNDIRQTVNTRWGPDWWRTALRAWKVSKTALSPVVHLNNVMANIVMADWHDIRPRHVYEALRTIAGDRTPARTAMLDAFEAEGGTQGMYVLSQLQRDQLAPILDQLRADLADSSDELGVAVGAAAALQALMSFRFRDARTAIANSKLAAAGKWPVSKLMNLYQAEDQVFRLAAFIQARERGMSDREAGRFARESFLDYDITAPWIRAMRDSAFPFISFTYRAVPMLADIAANKPHKLLKLALILGGLNALGYLFSGGDEDEERKLLPEEKAGRILGVLGPKLVRMPWNDQHGSPVFLDVRRFVPVGDFFETGQVHSALPMLPAAVPGGPLAVAAEILFNKSQFTGKAITKGTDTFGEQAAKVGGHVYKSFAPNLPILPGTYSFDAIANASTGRTDAFGREQSLGQAALSSVGVKVSSYPRDVAIRNLQMKHAGEVREINDNISALKREFERNGLTRERFEALVADQIGKRQKLDRELAEKVAP